MLNKKTVYAIEAIDYIAKQNRVVPLREVSSSLNISVLFLEQIFNILRRKGIVKSHRGPGGGYTLMGQTNALEVVLSIDSGIFNCFESSAILKQRGDKIKELLKETNLNYSIEIEDFPPREK